MQQEARVGQQKQVRGSRMQVYGSKSRYTTAEARVGQQDAQMCAGRRMCGGSKKRVCEQAIKHV